MIQQFIGGFRESTTEPALGEMMTKQYPYVRVKYENVCVGITAGKPMHIWKLCATALLLLTHKKLLPKFGISQRIPFERN